MVSQAAKELTRAITKHAPTAQLATNFELLQKLSKIFDEVAKEKVSEEQWEEPEVARMLWEAQNNPTQLRVRKNSASIPRCRNNHRRRG